MSETVKKQHSHRKNRKRNQRIRTLTNVLKALLALIVVAVVIAAVVAVGKKLQDSKTPSKTATETQSTETPEATEKVLEKDAVPEINDLVNRYFTAIHECNMEELSTIVASTEAISEDQLKTEAEFVESYEDVSCYTAKGVVDGSYIAYVSYGLKLANINTAAPCMIRLYICTNESGQYYIYNENTVDDATAEYMETLSKNAEVTALLKSVDDSLTAARGADADLNKFVAMLNGETDTTDGETQPADGGETPATAEEVFTDVNETVYAKEAVRVRAEAKADAEVLGAIQVGEAVKRTGYSDNFSRVEFEGKTGYVAAGYLTTKKPEESADSDDNGGFTTVSEKVYAKESVRIRKSPSIDSDEIGYLLEGDSIKRTGYNDNWSRVEIDGKTGYIAAGYLTEYAPGSQD